MVLADDPETMHDMPVLLDRMGHKLVDVVKSAGEFHFIIEVCLRKLMRFQVKQNYY